MARTLLAFVEDDVDDAVVAALQELDADFVEGEDEDGTPYVGVEYEIASEDREEYERVAALVDALCDVSVLGCDIVIEVDDEELGEIQQGAMTPGVRFDLLGSWEQRLT